MLTVYMGWDSREVLAYDVAGSSLLARASVPVTVVPVGLSAFGIPQRPIERRDGKLWCPISQAPMATEFAISRFAVPFIHKSGWALFADCDVLFRADVAELFALADDRYAVMCVQHNQQVRDGDTKMDGQIQTAYARKNWSSVVLWNCSHPAHQRLTGHKLDTLPGRDLHRFCWLKDDEIGSLPAEWNYLVGVNEPADALGAKLLHYTLGGPWLPGWRDRPADHWWRAEYATLEAGRGI